MFRTIDTKMWTDPKVRALSIEGKAVFPYLIGNSHTHLSGIYHLPKAFIAYELGLSDKVLDRVLLEIENLGLAYFDNDTDTVFVRSMFKYQGRGEKNEISAAKQLLTLHNSPLIKDFLALYPKVAKYADHTLLDTLYHSLPVKEKEQKQDREQEQEQEQEDYVPSASPSEPSATKTAEPAEPVLVEIPLCEKAADGNPRLFQVVESLAAQWQEDFPGVDVLAELRKARAWSDANPSRRKTPRGIKSHLASWLSRAQDKGGRRIVAGGNGSASAVPHSPDIVALPDGRTVSRAAYNTHLAGQRVLEKIYGQNSDGSDASD